MATIDIIITTFAILLTISGSFLYVYFTWLSVRAILQLLRSREE